MASTPAIATRIEPEYWTPAEFAKFAKLTTDQVSKLRINGGGPPFCKLGRHVRYLNLDVLAWHRQHSMTSTKEAA